MSKELICPRCGMNLPIDAKDLAVPTESTPDAGRTIETVIPGTLSSSEFVFPVPRTQGAGVLLASPDPGRDPHLNIFVTGDVAPETPPGEPEFEPAEGASQVAPIRLSSSSGDRPQAVDSDTVVVVPTSEADALGTSLQAAPADALVAPPGIPPISVREKALLRSSSSGEIGRAGELEPGRTSWRMVLLGSYASAITLAFLWLWWHPRTRVDSPVGESSPADARFERGLRGDQSVKLAPVTPLPEKLVTSLGKSLVVDALEVTPVDVSHRAVMLEHRNQDGEVETREGGSGAWVLHVRLKNTSQDQIFAPLDEAFVRQRESGAADSFIETPTAGRIEMYPLAVESEWAIPDQSFRAIRPGETLDTIVVTDKNASGNEAAEMTWRLRLRTSADRTEVVGVRIRKEEIQ